MRREGRTWREERSARRPRTTGCINPLRAREFPSFPTTPNPPARIHPMPPRKRANDGEPATTRSKKAAKTENGESAPKSKGRKGPVRPTCLNSKPTRLPYSFSERAGIQRVQSQGSPYPRRVHAYAAEHREGQGRQRRQGRGIYRQPHARPYQIPDDFVWVEGDQTHPSRACWRGR